jgi:NADPH-dependent glutamate synthase beta subunit-like oxidoreductase/formate hydrogenlyase subunit 6/NADH:ubiquinone oxidoreductase subunit I
MTWDDLVRPWVSIAKGHAETLKQMVSPPVTRQYPEEPAVLSPRWRGPLRLRGVMDDEPPPITDAPPLEFNDLMNDLHEQQRIAPCQGGCPANVDARGQNALVAAGRYIEAYNLVRRRNVLPAVLGYVCNNPCEDVCRRSYLDDPIAIRQLHRDCFEVYDREVRYPGHLENLVQRSEHVAVVGAGPAGIAAAYDLVQMGYQVTIYEREPIPGGLLVTSVPLYRLDREVVAKEIADIAEMGVEFRFGVSVGVDVTLDELRADHDAVIIAVGYSGGRILPIPGHDAEGVWSAIDFLHAYCMGEEPKVGPEVVVIGGGDVGCDCSRSALRCGATLSMQAHVETRAEMPGQEVEVSGAIEEGVVFLSSWGPEEILVEDGKVAGMRLKKVLSRFDATGNWNLQYSDEVTEVRCQNVIFAVGQRLQLDFLEGSGVTFDDLGRPLCNVTTGETDVPGVFLAGDLATGPKTIIMAIGQAHEAAISAHRYIQGRDLKDDRRDPVHPTEYYLQKLYAPHPPEFEHFGPGGRRIHMPESEPKKRIRTGSQVELGWAKGDGRREAIRCMRCQTHVCVACTLCARVCPDNCIDVVGHDTGYERRVERYDFAMEWCCFCGFCQDVCPTQTLKLAASFDYARPDRREFFYDRETMLRPFDGPDEIPNKDGLP